MNRQRSREKFYVINYSDGWWEAGYFKSYISALKLAEYVLAYKESDCTFTISVYADEEDYFNSL